MSIATEQLAGDLDLPVALCKSPVWTTEEQHHSWCCLLLRLTALLAGGCEREHLHFHVATLDDVEVGNCSCSEGSSVEVGAKLTYSPD